MPGEGLRRAFVVGHPVAHSRSPLIHGHWLRQGNVEGAYERIDVPPERLAGFLRGSAGMGFVGGNVTVPHKESAFRIVDRATERARRVRAVNTVWWEPGGELVGDSTDGFGFAAALDDAIGPAWPATAGTAVVLGAGGAAASIVGALLDRGVASIVVSNRTAARAAGLAGLEPARVRVTPWPVGREMLSTAGLLVNATRLGMAGDGPLALEVDALPGRAVVADIVYTPLETQLLAAARARGLRVLDGLGMLMHQAAPGFEAWFGTRPVVTPALRALLEADLGRAS